jgi:CRP/FNR family transcriptional regulator, anaerobic regulatory protein
MKYLKDSKEECKECTISKCFVKTCKPEWQEYANKHRTVQKFQKNNPIIIEGSYAAGLYFISSGNVKITSSWGSEYPKIIKFSRLGDILGFSGFGNGYNYNNISATAATETRTCFFEKNIMENLMLNNAQLSMHMVAMVASDLMKSENRVNLISQKSVRERTAYTLLELSGKFGKEVDGNYVLDLNISRKELAEYVGTTRENVSSILSDFASDNYIAVNGSEIEILNYDKLQKVTNLNGYQAAFNYSSN